MTEQATAIKQVTLDNLLDGSYYNWLYSRPFYRDAYDPDTFPQWAQDTNRWLVHYVAGILALDCETRILDLGSGMGHFVRAWRGIGFPNVTGLEISQAAIERSGETCIRHGSVADLGMFKDDEFDLVFSAALFEHVPEQVLDNAITECFRVGRLQVHSIAVEPGTDPTHVNIKTPHEWGRRFAEKTQSVVMFLTEPVFRESPVIFAVPGPVFPRPFHKMATDGMS